MSPHLPDETLYDSLLGEDELGLVVRAHIHVEARLNKLLDAFTLRPALLPRLRYEQRVNLAAALGLAERAVPPLKKIGDIRNLFGHKVDTSLTAGIIDDFFQTFSEVDQKAILDGHKKTHAALPTQVPENFSDLSPRGKFIVMAIALVKFLDTAYAEVSAE